MEIKTLGVSCSKCKKLSERTERVAKELGLTYCLEKVTDLEEIMSYSVMTTPTLIVDGVIKASGNVPSEYELKEILKEA